MPQQILIRRDISTVWTAVNPILAEGEMGLETDTLQLKAGTGSVAWNELPYMSGGEGGSANHSLLLNLLADDHTQYHTNARGDARYATKAQGAKADTAVQPETLPPAVSLTPIATYTETGLVLPFVHSSTGPIYIPRDGRVYSLTITGDCNLISTGPVLPESAIVTVAILINTATPPVISLTATWRWADKKITPIPTANGAESILMLASYPNGWVEASVREIGVAV